MKARPFFRLGPAQLTTGAADLVSGEITLPGGYPPPGTRDVHGGIAGESGLRANGEEPRRTVQFRHTQRIEHRIFLLTEGSADRLPTREVDLLGLLSLCGFRPLREIVGSELFHLERLLGQGSISEEFTRFRAEGRVCLAPPEHKPSLEPCIPTRSGSTGWGTSNSPATSSRNITTPPVPPPDHQHRHSPHPRVQPVRTPPAASFRKATAECWKAHDYARLASVQSGRTLNCA